MSDDDPEQRIRNLERPLADSAAATESTSGAAYLPDRQGAGMRLGWIVLGLLILALVIGGGSMIAERVSAQGKPVTGRPTAAELAGGGGSFTVAPPPSAVPPTQPGQPTLPTFAPSPPDTNAEISVAGVGKSERYGCESRIVTVSGVDNKVLLTGHCTLVVVSGVGNAVTIEESEAIVVSGMNNVVTFRNGSPELTKSGMNNTLERG
ncbi:MAG: DUF3060 domain-containing protein [Mycobacterium sp.]